MQLTTQAIIDSRNLNPQNNYLYQILLWAFQEKQDSLHKIEQTFNQLTSKYQNSNSLKYFFQSWLKTNNSAISVCGLASRITLFAQNQQIKKQLSLLEVCTNLQRITDEDLGAGGGPLHSDLYYKMATRICGDDLWMSKIFCLQSAYKFKKWADQQRLREKLINGLLITLIHEIYTHAELEYIYPLYI